jgi:hypothetical protein
MELIYMRKTFDLNDDLNKAVNEIAANEKTKSKQILNTFIEFAVYCYKLLKKNNLNTGQSKEIFERGVKCYVDNERRNNH